MEAPVRLLHIAPASYSLTVLLRNRLRLLSEQGYENAGLTTSVGFDFDAAAELAEVDTDFVESRWLTRELSPLSDLRFVHEVYEIVGRMKPDVVLTYGPKPGYFARVGARLAGATVVHTYWGLPYSDQDGRLKRVTLAALDLLTAGFAHRTLAVNADLVERARKYPTVKSGTVSYIGNGTDIDTCFNPELIDQSSIDNLRDEYSVGERVVVLMVGRKVRDKGYNELLAAATALIDRGVPVQFWLVGAADNARSEGYTQEAAASLRDQGHVVDLGERTHEEMPLVYASADLVCLPSYREGFPRALVEAASMGLPLVATDIAGCREIVRPGINGFLVPVADAGGLANGLEKLISNESLRQEYGARSRAIAQEECSDEVLVENLTSVIHESLASRGR